MSEWSAWGIIVVIIICFLVYDMLRRAKEKIYIKAYTEVKTEDGGKTFSELELIGEFKDEWFNPDRRCYEFRFRNNFRYFTVFSNYTMAQYMEVHKIERVYFIYYALNTYVFKKNLQEPYERELGWSIQAYIYRFLSFLLLICGTVFYFSMPVFPLAFLIGCLVGFLISVLNYSLQKSSTIAKSLLKKKKETVSEELYMTPLEAEEEVLDVYRIKATITKRVKTSDKVKENQVVPLIDNNKVDYFTVTGYDDLFKLINNPLITITHKEIVGIERRKRTNQEMLNLRRSYLTRNRAFAEDNFRIKEEIERLQKEYRNLEIQLQHVRETKDTEVRKALHQVTKERDKQGNTLMNIYEELLGAEFVSENFEQTHQRVMNRIEQARENTKADKLDMLIQSIGKLFDLIGQKADLNVDQITRLLKANQSLNGDGEKKNEAAAT